MALQDLTPQLRTRLSRMERAVGWFVFLATTLLLFGFGYYLYHVAENRGWFLVKAKFFTYVSSATGLSVGDPVNLMGFQVGRITSIEAMPPRTPHTVRIEFIINQVNQTGEPYFSYIWSEGSQVKVKSSDFLGKRLLEVTRGTNGFGLYQTHSLYKLSIQQAENLADPDKWRLAENIFDENSNRVFRAYTVLEKSNVVKIAEFKPETIYAFHVAKNHNYMAASWHQDLQRYENWSETNGPVELPSSESPAVTEQLQAVVTRVQDALPHFLALTNQLAAVLANSANATSNLNAAVAEARPIITNFAAVSAQLRQPGGLGVWALGANGNGQMLGALTNANSLLAHTDTNFTAILFHLADITSNLRAQVQANSDMLDNISKMVVDADDFVQGLKHHWLLRSAFKKENKNDPAPKP
ncbi:MAG: MlaD family protein [Limisphaerales bacterium]